MDQSGNSLALGSLGFVSGRFGAMNGAGTLVCEPSKVFLGSTAHRILAEAFPGFVARRILAVTLWAGAMGG